MKKPKIRFKGFNDDWEQRKLGEIGSASSGVGFPNSEQGGKEGIPFYKVSDMNLEGNEIEMTVSNNYVTKEQIARKKWSPLNDVPAMYFAKVGAAVMLNRKRLCRFPFLFDNNTMAYSLNKEYWDINFAKAEFAKIDLTKLVQVGALPSYNANDVESIKIMIPSLFEQSKIGNYFDELDRLITLHQRKCDEIKKLKKYMLQNMFPQNDEKAPKIRFNGFTDDWEQRKLGDTLVELKSGLSRMLSNNDIGLPVIRANNINEGYLNMETDIKYWYEKDPQGADINNYLVSKGDILINFINSEAKMGTATVVQKVLNRKTIYTTNILKARVDENYDKYFWFTLTLTDKYKNDIKIITKPAVNQASFTTVDFKKLSYLFPNLKEQQKIGNYFSNLDRLITLHQRKCDELKNMKKFMLQNMFV